MGGAVVIGGVVVTIVADVGEVGVVTESVVTGEVVVVAGEVVIASGGVVVAGNVVVVTNGVVLDLI